MTARVRPWPVGTVIRARYVLVDWDHENRPYIKAQPGELGLVWEATRGDPETFEVMFSGGCFTTTMDDFAIERYEGVVSNVVEPPDGCGHSSPTK